MFSQEIQENKGERSLNSGDLKGKVCCLLERTPDFQRELIRLCVKSKKVGDAPADLPLSHPLDFQNRQSLTYNQGQ